MPTSAPLVLVADDEPSMLELVARHLRTMNDPKLEVIQASDGEEAWRLAREHLPDLVVLDVMMPGMSGWEVCRKIREDVALAHTGVVMLTGIGENLNQMTSPLYGADAYIDKPFEFDDFDDKIRDTLKARTKQREGVVRPPINGTAGAAKPMSADEGRSVRPAKAAAKPAAKKAERAPVKKAASQDEDRRQAGREEGRREEARREEARRQEGAARRRRPAKKPAAKKAPAKKPAAKKAPAKKAPAKKPAAKKSAAKKK